MSKEISVRLGSVNYACAISDGHHEWLIDEPVTNGGSDIAYDPYGALLASLGSCSAITMKMYAQRKGWQVDDIEIKLSLAMEIVGGRRKTVFTRNMLIKGNLDSDQITRLQQIATACPISKMLEGDIIIETGLVPASNDYPLNSSETDDNS